MQGRNMAIKIDVENALQNGIRSRLIPEEKTFHNKDENNWMVYLSTFVAVWGSFIFGMCIGYSSPTQNAIREDLNLTIAEYSLFGSILTFGAMIGAITSGYIADKFGRKGAMRVSIAFCSAGWLAIYFTEGSLPMDVGRIATGYASGLCSYVVPVFIAEIAPKNLRGALTTTNQLLIVTGISVAFMLGTVLTWRDLALTGLVPCAVLFLGLFFIPESPRWLAKTGNSKGFEIALRKLRGKDADISEEATEIQEFIDRLERLPKASLFDLFERRYMRPLTIAVGLMVAQQFGGINGIMFYTSSIFESAGVPSSTGTIIFALLQVVITALGTIFVDRAGRKPLLLVAASGMVVGSLLVALSFYFKTYQIDSAAAPALALTGILVYIAGFSIGMGAVPWVIMSEIFPINVKGVAGSLTTVVNWFGAWAVSYTFNFLMTWSSYGTFILYGGINILSILFVMEVVPETKGRTLEQIHGSM